MHPLASEMTIRPELLGAEPLLNPFSQFTSSQRLSMFAQHIGQTVVLHHAEPPRIASGFEPLVGRYAFDKIWLEHDAHVKASIPRYNPMLTVGQNTDCVVIYVTEDGKIDYFELQSHNNAHKFGYRNIWTDQKNRIPGAIIPKGEFAYSHAPNQDENLFNFGIEANVLYTSEVGTEEDACVIDRETQRRLTYTAVTEVVIDLKPDQLLLNMYGDDVEYKVLPDINQKVRPDGVLMAVRNINMNDPLITDLRDSALTPNMYDTVWEAPTHARVISIEVHRSRASKTVLSENVYTQLFDYYDHGIKFYQQVVEWYVNLTKEGYTPTKSFSVLVEMSLRELAIANTHHGKKITFAKKNDKRYPGVDHSKKFKAVEQFLDSSRSKRLVVTSGNKQVEFIQVKIRYAYDNVPVKGYKLTGRHGNKGVISEVRETEDMPVDKYGNRANILISLKGGFNRMNFGQFNEQAINAIRILVTRTICDAPDNQTGFNILMDFLNELWPAYARIVRQKYNTPHKVDKCIQSIKENGIYLVLLPYLNVDYETIIPRLKRKYNFETTPVSYVVHTIEGPKVIHTELPMLVGSSYILALCKDPIMQTYGVSMAYVSQLQLPVVPSKTAKSLSTTRSTPIRMGEDEISLLIESIGADETSRQMGLWSGTPVASDKLGVMLLTHPHPSRIGRVNISNEEIAANSTRINAIKHKLGALGIEFVNNDAESAGWDVEGARTSTTYMDGEEEVEVVDNTDEINYLIDDEEPEEEEDYDSE